MTEQLLTTEKNPPSYFAQHLAIKWHNDVNHQYDGQSYLIHLEMTTQTAEKFKHLIPANDWDDVLSACWLHDTIEDCRKTYNDILTTFNEHIAELVYAVTNEKGRSRKERANEEYYTGIRRTRYASFVKLCDRIANVSYGLSKVGREENRMVKMYRKEGETFNRGVYIARVYDEMFSHLDDLLDESQ